MADNDLTAPLREREPIRLPVWAAAIVGAAFNMAIALLLAEDITGRLIREELAQMLTVIGPIFAAVEVARGNVVTQPKAWIDAVAAEARGRAEGRKRSRAQSTRKR